VTVLAAHVDYNGRYGLFFHLAELANGATATVITANGSSYSFRVVSSRQVAETGVVRAGHIPYYGSPRLVLVTCGGDFIPAQRSYVDNVVVYAEPKS